jgi:hypothetical protein
LVIGCREEIFKRADTVEKRIKIYDAQEQELNNRTFLQFHSFYGNRNVHKVIRAKYRHVLELCGFHCELGGYQKTRKGCLGQKALTKKNDLSPRQPAIICEVFLGI